MTDAPQDRPTPNDFARRLLKDSEHDEQQAATDEHERPDQAEHDHEQTEDDERFDAG
ncbi:hypothetical protein GCM10023216_11230 [Isoptericola chiayiensis]|uniref:Uncharacterized protein n=1 Tax=Isoptericola chiayiensis TaxID=579446 RepID=A0ABP8Y811_9MICO|nr:hypothetical protein [Isoptericola chiayiensis]NOW00760.1 hypothetical protein [Isoptericola chiayiensis]